MGGRGSGGGRGGRSAAGGGGTSKADDWKASSGQWDIDVSGKGGAQILEGENLYNPGEKIFEVHMWDKDYNILPKINTTTLAEAKRRVKEKLDIGSINKKKGV